MILSDTNEHSCMFFFHQVQVPWCRHRESEELRWSRLGVGQEIMMEEGRGRDMSLFVRCHEIQFGYGGR